MVTGTEALQTKEPPRGQVSRATRAADGHPPVTRIYRVPLVGSALRGRKQDTEAPIQSLADRRGARAPPAQSGGCVALLCRVVVSCFAVLCWNTISSDRVGMGEKTPASPPVTEQARRWLHALPAEQSRRPPSARAAGRRNAHAPRPPPRELRWGSVRFCSLRAGCKRLPVGLLRNERP